MNLKSAASVSSLLNTPRVMLLRLFYTLIGALSVLNALIMLFAPVYWYGELIEGVKNTGPMNLHFIRDIGLAFLACGLGSLWIALRLRESRALHFGITIFIGGHGVFHVLEILRGSLPHEHWRLDAVGVLIPAAILLILCVPQVWRFFVPQDVSA